MFYRYTLFSVVIDVMNFWFHKSDVSRGIFNVTESVALKWRPSRPKVLYVVGLSG